MTRTLDSTLTNAIAGTWTDPKWLVFMGWAVESRIALWDSNITWNSQTWTATGAQLENLTPSGGVLRLPLDDDQTWIALVLGEKPRGKEIKCYLHYTDRTVSPWATSALLFFSGVMDSAIVDRDIRINLQDQRRVKLWPPYVVEHGTFNFLLDDGDTVTAGDDQIIAQEPKNRRRITARQLAQWRVNRRGG